MKTTITKRDVLNCLQNVNDPDLQQDIVSLGFVKNVEISPDMIVSVVIELTTPACPFKKHLLEEAEKNIRSLSGVREVKIEMTSNVEGNSFDLVSKYLPDVKNIILVASGKGGVGKSTVSTNIAVALSELKASVGLLDADVYGPSMPLQLGMSGVQIESDGESMLPAQRYGLKTFSMGFFLPTEKAAIWRGPMLDKLITQFISDVKWGKLDYLIIDLPPGTGDVQISLCQKLNVTGAVIVSTPQDAALNIAQKAISMFYELQCPILGIVENMSYYICSHCQEKDYIFGHGIVSQYCQEHKIPFLGEIPLATCIRSQSDQGLPVVLSHPESFEAKAFYTITQNITSQACIGNIKKE